MTAQHAYAHDVEHGDNGDGGPVYSWVDMALGLARVLHRLRERGPYFAAAVDAAIADLQKE